MIELLSLTLPTAVLTDVYVSDSTPDYPVPAVYGNFKTRGSNIRVVFKNFKPADIEKLELISTRYVLGIIVRQIKDGKQLIEVHQLSAGSDKGVQPAGA